MSNEVCLLSTRLLRRSLVTHIVGQTITVTLRCRHTSARKRVKNKFPQIKFGYRTTSAWAKVSGGQETGNHCTVSSSSPLSSYWKLWSKTTTGPWCCACSLSLPGGKPIDLQFILTSVKSMRRDMKSPRFLRLQSKIPETLCNSR